MACPRATPAALGGVPPLGALPVRRAAEAKHAATLIADVPDFTNGKPAIQFNASVG